MQIAKMALTAIRTAIQNQIQILNRLLKNNKKVRPQLHRDEVADVVEVAQAVEKTPNQEVPGQARD